MYSIIRHADTQIPAYLQLRYVQHHKTCRHTNTCLSTSSHESDGKCLNVHNIRWLGQQRKRIKMIGFDDYNYNLHNAH